MEEQKIQQPKSSDSAYLEKLEFNQELKKSWLSFFVTNFRVVILIIMLLSGWGLYSFVKLPRESNPEVKIPIAVLSVVYPGVSPADMEELVTKKIETNISGISGIKKITSSSSNSVSSVTVEFEADQNLDDSIRKLRDKLSSIRNDIPEGANDPAVHEISFDDTPIMSISLTGPYDGFTMRSYAEKLQDELEKIPGIREVNVSGGDEAEFEVAYDPQKLASFGITAEQANQAIASTNKAIPAGNFEGDRFNFPIRTDSRFFNVESLGNVPVSGSNGSVVYLKDLAGIQEKAINKTILSRISTEGSKPQNSVTLQIIKRTGGSIITAADSADKKVSELLQTFPSGIKYEVTFNQADQIRKDFDQLTHDFFLTLALVVIILVLIVGLKEAFVAGLAIPLVFFTTFGVMLSTGTSLNFLSIFSLLLSLGLLVDDAIVVVSATKQYMKTGKFTPEEAVLLVLNDFKVVLLSTTLATVWAFLPLLMSTGIMGEFIKSIPITVSVTLLASLLIALMINHPLAAVLERIRLTKKFFFLILASMIALGSVGAMQNSFTGYSISAFSFGIIAWMLSWYFSEGKNILVENKRLAGMEWESDELIKQKLLHQGDRENQSLATKIIHGVIHFERVLPTYEKYLRKVTATKKARWTTIIATAILFLFAAALPITGIVKSEFFPESDMDIINISLRATTGLTLEQMDGITQQVENKLQKYPEIKNYSTLVGNPGSNSPIRGGSNNSNTSSITVKLVDKKERNINSNELGRKIREDMADIQDAEVTVSSPKGGPPSGASFQAQISGDDLQKLDKIANELKPVIASLPGAINATVSLREAPAEYTFALDPAKMQLYGLNASQIGGTLRMAISGTTVTNVIRDNKTIDVIAKFDEKRISNLDAVGNLQILNSLKQPVFLKEVAEIKLKPSVESISRIDQKRTVLLTADTDGTKSSNEILAEFQKKLKENYQLPEGYNITYGGENESNTESVMSILRAMIIAMLLIVSTLVIQFNSFKKALIVLVTLPLALIGVFIGMAIAGVSLSFPGLIGILALFGIVVKNAIILIDKINLNIKSGIPFEASIIDAGKSRLEAIFITSIVTIAGIIPITLSNGMWTALGTAVIFGLSISSFFTLFIIPVLYMTFIDEKERL